MRIGVCVEADGRAAALERLLAYWRSRGAAGFPGEEEEP